MRKGKGRGSKSERDCRKGRGERKIGGEREGGMGGRQEMEGGKLGWMDGGGGAIGEGVSLESSNIQQEQ